MKIKAFTILVFGLFHLFVNRVIAQDNNLYFMVDTISIPKEQRIVSINKTVPSTLYENEYEFFLQVHLTLQKKLNFFYINTKKDAKDDLLHTKPNYKYLSWQELISLIEKHQNDFDKIYNLHIIEVLPNNKYKNNLVKLERYTRVE